MTGGKWTAPWAVPRSPWREVHQPGVSHEGPVGRKGLGLPAWLEMEPAELLSKSGAQKKQAEGRGLGSLAGSTDCRSPAHRRQVGWLRGDGERVLVLWGRSSQKNAQCTPGMNTCHFAHSARGSWSPPTQRETETQPSPQCRV